MPFGERIERDGGADVGDDEHELEERADGDAGVVAAADDVVVVVRTGRRGAQRGLM